MTTLVYVNARDVDRVVAYLGTNGATYTKDEITSALTAEANAQRRAVRMPGDRFLDHPCGPPETITGVFDIGMPGDLQEALCRRVAANLANRRLPLGVDTQVSEFGGAATRVGGTNSEVRRLEAPYRRLVIG